MAGYVALGALAAFGLLSLLWATFGWLLPGGKGCAVVCCGMPDEGILTRFKWLKSLGLLNCPLIIIAEDAQSVPPETEICSREELLLRLEWERKRFDRTGNGDHTRRHQRRGISEL